MKKLLFALIMILPMIGMSQIKYANETQFVNDGGFRVADENTPFGCDLPNKTVILDVKNHVYYEVIHKDGKDGAKYTETLKTLNNMAYAGIDGKDLIYLSDGKLHRDGQIGDPCPDQKLFVNPKPNFFVEWQKYLSDCNQLVPDTVSQSGTVKCELVPVKMNGKIVSYNTVPIDTAWNKCDCEDYKFPKPSVITGGWLTNGNGNRKETNNYRLSFYRMCNQ